MEPALDPAASDPLDELLAAIVAHATPSEELERACALHPERAATLRSRFALLSEFGLVDAAPPPPTAVPRRIAGFAIVRQIGEGGMGAVYEARQENPRRTIALKVLRAGLMSPEAMRRFEREAEILGRLQHPGIARVYAAGVGDVEQATGVAGQAPYLAMELVAGKSLDAYVREHRLDLTAKLELLARIADAVQYMHDHGVLHRDLKPGNLLVEDLATGPQPRVLDFGLARATHADELLSQHTGTGQVLGTLAYMSPEQVRLRSTELDARTDVYSLGVVLFELVAGRLPYDVIGRSIPEAARIVCEHEAPRLGTLDSHWRGDVDTIVAKALEKDRERRYASAAELATDLRRMLRHEAIHARPASRWYQLRKFTRRHRVLVGGVVATFAALAAGLLLALRQAHLAELARDRAERFGYRAALEAALAATEVMDTASARRHLGAAPPMAHGFEWRYVAHLADRSVRTLQESALVGGVVTGRPWFAGYERDGSMSLRELRTGAIVHTLQRRNREGQVMVAAPAGVARLCTQGFQGAQLLDPATDTVVRELPSRVGPNPFDPTGRWLVVGVDQPRRIAVLDAATGTEVRSIATDGRSCSCASFSADGSSVLYAASDPCTVVLRDASTGTTRWQAPGRLPSFSRDGRLVLAASGSGSDDRPDRLEVRAATTGELLATLASEPGAVQSWDTSPDGARIALRLRSGVEIHDAWSFQRLGGLCGLGPWSETVNAVFADHAPELVATGADGAVKFWNASISAMPFVVPWQRDGSQMTAAALSADARWTATGEWGGIRLFDARTGARKWVRFPHTWFATAIGFSPDATRLASLSSGRLVVQEVAGGRTLAARRMPVAQEFYRGLAWTADARHLLVGLDDGSVQMLEVPSGEPGTAEPPLASARVFGGASAAPCPVVRLTRSPDGRHLAVLSRGGPPAPPLLRLFDLTGDGGAPRWQVEGPEHVAFGADGATIATAGAAAALTLRRLVDGRPIRVLSEASHPPGPIAFAPDGARLAVMDETGAVQIWDARAEHTGGALLSLRVPAWRDRGEVYCIAFDPAGDALRLVTTSHAVVAFEIATPAAGEAERERIRRAREIADRARDALDNPLVADVVARIAADASLPPALVDEAIAQARARGDQARVWLNLVDLRVERPDSPLPDLAEAMRGVGVVAAAYGDLRGLAPHLRGVLHLRAGDHAAAVADLADAAAAGDRAVSWAALAIAHRRQGDTGAAAAALARAQAALAAKADDDARAWVAAAVAEVPR